MMKESSSASNLGFATQSEQSLGGGGWIRTIVGVSQQIYSLPPLATRAPLRSEWQIMRTEMHFVKCFSIFDAILVAFGVSNPLF